VTSLQPPRRLRVSAAALASLLLLGVTGDGNDAIFSRDRIKETSVRGGAGTDRARKNKADKTTSVERVL
jgi:hypothetical protein